MLSYYFLHSTDLIIPPLHDNVKVHVLPPAVAVHVDVLADVGEEPEGGHQAVGVVAAAALVSPSEKPH